MRYKIKTPNEQTYRDIQETLRAKTFRYMLSLIDAGQYLQGTFPQNCARIYKTAVLK